MLNDTDDPEFFDVNPDEDFNHDTKDFLDQEALELERELNDDDGLLYGDEADDY